MGALEHEIDFPRGGATAVPPHQKDSSHSSKHKFGKAGNQLFGVDKKRGTKRKEPVTAEIPAKKRKRDGKEMVWTKAVTQKLLTDGVMGLGVVTEIYADYVLLETAYSCRVKLLATQISKKFTDLLKSEKVSLDSTFVVGQMVPFRVIERSSQTIEKKRGSAGMKKASEVLPLVTCDPSKLNAHLIPLTLMPGLVLHAVVISQEEKGAVMDIGMQSMQAFLPTEKQQRPVEVGQPVIVGIDSLKTSRVVVVTSYVEQSSLCLEACESLMLNHLMPGTIIECVPDPQPSVSAGVYVTLGNGVRGFVAKSHLPPRLRCDITKVGKTLRCVVMFCQQNTPLLVLSAHPDIVAISKLEKRSSFMYRAVLCYKRIEKLLTQISS
uniref:S1 motif domain-containing protein n=1 Tax=Angiostrongylus cantonensis TaxID=6313 RepID=A0A0K0D496_ANGCA